MTGLQLFATIHRMFGYPQTCAWALSKFPSYVEDWRSNDRQSSCHTQARLHKKQKPIPTIQNVREHS